MPGTAKPVYLLVGTDAFLRDAYRREIVRCAVGEADPQTAVASFDGSVAAADVFDELRTLPFLAPRRVVIVADADEFVSSYRKRLEEYVQAPVDSAVLILALSSERSNTRLAKLVREVGEIRNCSSPTRGLRARITEMVRKRRKKLSPGAAELLEASVGADLAALDGEIEKLSLYVGDRDTISDRDVAEMVTATAGPQAFALSNALIEGRADAALRAVAGMLVRPGDEFRALGSIGWHLRRALHGQQLAAAGEPPVGALNPRTPPATKRAFLDLLRRRPLGKLQEDFRRLIRADLSMKTGRDGRAALEELVVALCG